MSTLPVHSPLVKNASHALPANEITDISNVSEQTSTTCTPILPSPTTSPEHISSPPSVAPTNAPSNSPKDQQASTDMLPASLHSALVNSRDRMFALRLEHDITCFLDSTHDSIELKPMNSYYRLLSHQVSDYYQLGHIVSPNGATVILFKTSKTKPSNVKRIQGLSKLVPKEDFADVMFNGGLNAGGTILSINPQFRVMKKNNTSFTKPSSTSNVKARHSISGPPVRSTSIADSNTTNESKPDHEDTSNNSEGTSITSTIADPPSSLRNATKRNNIKRQHPKMNNLNGIDTNLSSSGYYIPPRSFSPLSVNQQNQPMMMSPPFYAANTSYPNSPIALIPSPQSMGPNPMQGFGSPPMGHHFLVGSPDSQPSNMPSGYISPRGQSPFAASPGPPGHSGPKFGQPRPHSISGVSTGHGKSNINDVMNHPPPNVQMIQSPGMYPTQMLYQVDSVLPTFFQYPTSTSSMTQGIMYPYPPVSNGLSSPSNQGQSQGNPHSLVPINIPVGSPQMSMGPMGPISPISPVPLMQFGMVSGANPGHQHTGDMFQYPIPGIQGSNNSSKSGYRGKKYYKGNWSRNKNHPANHDQAHSPTNNITITGDDHDITTNSSKYKSEQTTINTTTTTVETEPSHDDIVNEVEALAISQ